MDQFMYRKSLVSLTRNIVITTRTNSRVLICILGELKAYFSPNYLIF